MVKNKSGDTELLFNILITALWQPDTTQIIIIRPQHTLDFPQGRLNFGPLLRGMLDIEASDVLVFCSNAPAMYWNAQGRKRFLDRVQVVLLVVCHNYRQG